MRRFRILFAGLALFGLAFVPTAAQQDAKKADKKREQIECRIIYVPTDQAIVDKMLEIAQVKKTDVVFDLGCGDGRIVCTAAKKFGAKGVGVDIDPDRIRDCHKTLEKMKVPKDMVEFREGDALKVKDLERASVVMLYMLPEFMNKLELQVSRLKPGTRIVAHDFPFPNIPIDRAVEFRVSDTERPKMLYLWVVREKK